jgi:hypothetical protein
MFSTFTAPILLYPIYADRLTFSFTYVLLQGAPLSQGRSVVNTARAACPLLQTTLLSNNTSQVSLLMSSLCFDPSPFTNSMLLPHSKTCHTDCIIVRPQASSRRKRYVHSATQHARSQFCMIQKCLFQAISQVA